MSMSSAIDSTAQSGGATKLEFPHGPGRGPSAVRRWRERCLLAAIQPLRHLPRRFEQAIGIITYHQVTAGLPVDRQMLNVTPRRFSVQLEGLLRLGYEAWSLRRVLDYERAGEPIPREVFVVVFDDGFESVYLNAWPVLKQLQIPATIFMATAYLGQDRPFPFDRTANRNLPPAVWRPLTLRQCHEMLDSRLIDLGTHTHTHADFRRRPSEFESDLEQSLQVLEEQFGVTGPTLSFPFGFAEPELVAIARRLGLSCGLTTDCELVLPGTDPFGWGRFGAIEFDSSRTLAAKLDGWYSRLREVWRCCRRAAGDWRSP